MRESRSSMGRFPTPIQPGKGEGATKGEGKTDRKKQGNVIRWVDEATVKTDSEQWGTEPPTNKEAGVEPK